MGYQKTNGQWANTLNWTPVDAGTVISASGSSAVFEAGEYATARLTAAFTAVAGTNPTLDIKLMTCRTADGSFREVKTRANGQAFTQFTTATSQEISLSDCDRFVRLDWTIGGTSTPSFTGGISGEVA